MAFPIAFKEDFKLTHLSFGEVRSNTTIFSKNFHCSLDHFPMKASIVCSLRILFFDVPLSLETSYVYFGIWVRVSLAMSVHCVSVDFSTLVFVCFKVCGRWICF